MLYNAPRAATIIAKTDCILYALDRECFNNIVKDSAVKRREKYEIFLGKVDLLSTMDPYEKAQLADVLVTCKFKKGDYVIHQVIFNFSFFNSFFTISKDLLKNKSQLLVLNSTKSNLKISILFFSISSFFYKKIIFSIKKLLLKFQY